jgi:hypothetical protein
MNANAYVNNPVLSKGFYYVKCTRVETTGCPGGETTLVELRIVPIPLYGTAANQFLYVTLRGTAKAAPLMQKFRSTFNVIGDPAEAVGRFGCVRVDPTEFQRRRYGAVHFVRQSSRALRKTLRLGCEDRHNLIPWAEEENAEADAFVL